MECGAWKARLPCPKANMPLHILVRITALVNGAKLKALGAAGAFRWAMACTRFTAAVALHGGVHAELSKDRRAGTLVFQPQARRLCLNCRFKNTPP
jgi:hypothetical protein